MQIVKNRKGFTLIEIMVVIVILALLAALVAPKLMGRADDAKITDAHVQIKNIETALKLYKLDNGNYPTTEQGLSALVTKPTVGVIPKSYKEDGYLEKKTIPKDPWGNDYLYLSPGEHGDYDLYSYGSDGAKGGEGKNADITSWETK
ncbi:MAG: type II secretion system major pseudopilin GspG [Proteobacteria bacterium]|nr:type II secretion system major pseudopilin GspG [Pseudomonadota bacterium]